MKSQGQPGLLGESLSEKKKTKNKQNKKWVSRIKCQQPYLKGLALDYRKGNVAGKDMGASWVLGQRRFLTGDGCAYLEQYQPALV